MLEEAKDRLVWAGDLAIEERLADCDHLLGRDDPESAAGHVRRIDDVLLQARSVGVRLNVPGDFESLRRGVFDDAFATALDRGAVAIRQGRWPDGVDEFRHARHEFEPTREQRNQALAAEAAALVEWSEAEFQYGHLRTAFEVAAQVPAMEWSPREDSDAALAMMDAALDAGELELLVLPVQPPSTRKKTERGHRSLTADLNEHVESALQQGPWRTPPPFVTLHEGLAAQDLITRADILDSEYNAATMALLLRLAGSDLAVHVQIVHDATTEFGLKTRPETATTKDGKDARFERETGTRRCQATARIVIADDLGNEVVDVMVDGVGEAPFERGSYDGDPRQLNLGSRQVNLFDGFALERQETAARDALVLDLATGIADAVFGATLARIP